VLLSIFIEDNKKLLFSRLEKCLGEGFKMTVKFKKIKKEGNERR